MNDPADRSWRLWIPAALTFGNIFSGVAAVWLIVIAMHRADASIEDLSAPAVMIFVGWAFDVLDGPAARHFAVAGPFGAVLDSLADGISFGVAPATLAFAAAWLTGDVALQAAMGIVGLFYVAAAIIRLARFTARAVDDGAAGAPGPSWRQFPIFSGLPSPAAGMTIATGILAMAEAAPDFGVAALAVVTALLATAMVSRLPYVDLPKALARRVLPRWSMAIPVLVGLAFGVPVGLLALFAPYLASGPLLALWRESEPGARP